VETDRGTKERHIEAQQRIVILKCQSRNEIHKEGIYIVFYNKKGMKTLSFAQTEDYSCSFPVNCKLINFRQQTSSC
jgi:hypothetical protein